MRKWLVILIAALSFAPIAYALPYYSSQQGLIPFVNSTYYLGTTTPSTLSWKGLIVDQICLTADTCRTTWPTGGSGSAFPFTSTSYGVSTSTTVGFLQGLLSTASSTFNSSFHLPSLSAGGLGVDASGLVYSGATTTFSSGLTYANGGVTCDVASGSVKGCLSSSDWTTFNNKQATISATWPITLSGATVGWGGLATSSPFAANQFVYTNAAGNLVSVASSSLSLPNSALQNSTISGVALGSNLNALTNDATLVGSSYNGSGAVSDWGIDLAHANSWTGLQTFANASTTLGSFSYASSTLYYGANLATCNSANSALTWNAGTFGCNTISGGGVWPFTTSDTNYSVAVQSTTTPEWFKNPVSGTVSLMASSTAWFDQINVGSTTSGTMATSTFFGNLSASGNLKATNIGIYGASNLISTSGTDLTFEETGDTGGITRLILENRTGQNGPLFVDPSLDLVDFGFQGSSHQDNIRMEGRAGQIVGQGNATYGEFKFGNFQGSAKLFATFGSTTAYIPSLLDVSTTSSSGAAVTIASTTGSQLAITGRGGNIWNFREAGGYLYIATSSPPSFATSSIPTLTVNPNGYVGIASSSPASLFSINGVLNAFSSGLLWLYGELVGFDATNGWNGRISPTHSFVLSTGTTTTWTATTSAAYVPSLVMPFAGTLKQVRCQASTTASFLGVTVFINSTKITPAYFVSSSTVGTIKITANNTFSIGDRVAAYFGTTTSDSAAVYDACTFDAVETP